MNLVLQLHAFNSQSSHLPNGKIVFFFLELPVRLLSKSEKKDECEVLDLLPDGWQVSKSHVPEMLPGSLGNKKMDKT